MEAKNCPSPLFFFSALQRQLGYPQVPRPERPKPIEDSPALLARRLEVTGRKVAVIVTGANIDREKLVGL